MTIIYDVGDLFTEKDLEKKRERVIAHYERAYHCKLRTLTSEEVESLYRSLKKLEEFQLFHREAN